MISSPKSGVHLEHHESGRFRTLNRAVPEVQRALDLAFWEREFMRLARTRERRQIKRRACFGWRS